MIKGRVAILKAKEDVGNVIRSALAQVGILDRLSTDTRVAIKPNFTYPYYRPGVTTSPAIIRETVKIIREYECPLAIVETDGGYGAWRAAQAFAGHNMHELRDEYGVEIVNLNDEPSEMIGFASGKQKHAVPLPTRLLHETDLFISMPVPKIHCMTGLTLSYKNQWGCVPDVMRLRQHHVFDDAIVAINRALKPVVLSDGTYFLDHNGPMEGSAVLMNLIIAADTAGAFDRYVSELMGFTWKRVRHLRRAVKLGDMPSRLEEIECNISPADARTHVFRLQRTLRNYIALCGFNSRCLTWLGYESWIGRVLAHKILYAITGKPVKPQP